MADVTVDMAALGREKWVCGRSMELLRGNAQNVASGRRRTATLYKLDDEQPGVDPYAAGLILHTDALWIFRRHML